MAVKITMPLFCKRILESDSPYNLLYGGRVGGKTNNTSKISVLTMLMYPYFDVIVARVSYGSLGDSSYAEAQAAINEMGDNISEQFQFKKSPLRIERLPTKDGKSAGTNDVIVKREKRTFVSSPPLNSFNGFIVKSPVIPQ